EAVRRQDGVEQSVGEEVLRGLDAGREVLAVQGPVDAGAEEADEGTGFGGGEVAERAPGGQDAPGGGVAQVHQVGQSGGLVGGDGGGDLHHLYEGGRALLHAGASGG